MSSIHIFGLEKGARTCQQIKAQTIFIEIFFAQELCQIFCPSFSKVWSMCSRQRQRTSQPCARSPTSRTCLSQCCINISLIKYLTSWATSLTPALKSFQSCATSQTASKRLKRLRRHHLLQQEPCLLRN